MLLVIQERKLSGLLLLLELKAHKDPKEHRALKAQPDQLGHKDLLDLPEQIAQCLVRKDLRDPKGLLGLLVQPVLLLTQLRWLAVLLALKLSGWLRLSDRKDHKGFKAHKVLKDLLVHRVQRVQTVLFPVLKGRKVLPVLMV